VADISLSGGIPVIKTIALAHRKAGLTREEYNQYWLEKHGPLAAKTSQGVEGSIQKEGERISMGRMGRPEEIANGILFLASDESSYVTGLELIIDGGMIIV
jgi:NAD(P)-dependent dehydrogenase (short-subunit alcohol dehydrogenase family)